MPPHDTEARYDKPRAYRRDHSRVLATDLDGTLIPLHGNRQNEVDLQTLKHEFERGDVTLIFVSGRHFDSVAQAIEQYQLPQPDWVICDVGTSIYQRLDSGEFQLLAGYEQHQDRIIASMPISVLRKHFRSTQGLRLQEEEQQGQFKLSFYTDATQLDQLVGHIREQLDQVHAPYSIIQSVDPFNGDGLIDLLPADVSKAHALDWWLQAADLTADLVVFAGDSGNDLAALTAGYRSILVGNADSALARRVHNAHVDSGWNNRLYFARGAATSGVLEGCRWFGLAETPTVQIEKLGATPVAQNETHFRVWAANRRSVAVKICDGPTSGLHILSHCKDGFFTGTVQGAGPGSLYQFVLDEELTRPDPASRFQPDGVHGPSQIVHPQAFAWTDQDWQGVSKRDLIIYELHLGTFTREGTFRAAIGRIPELVELGVTAVEIMPVAQSPGRWNWGYDGVDLFAVRNTYGSPDDFKALVDACHASGVAVILDVVYNHVGPEGNYLADYAPYFSRRHRTPWGEAFNFDGPNSEPVRRFIVDNALYWLDEYHLDGLRLDAVHFMLDDSQPTILDEIRRAVTEFAATSKRAVHLIAESNVYDRDLLTAKTTRAAYDAIWCDCLMHSIYSHALPELQLTQRKYDGASDLAEALRYGYVYVGPEHARASAQVRDELHRGEHGLPHTSSFVTALQTHDAVGNHPLGKRIHELTSKEFQRAAASLVLLFPSIPMLFMGEEFAIASPFLFFADFEDVQLRQAVDDGRAREHVRHVAHGAFSPSESEAFYHTKCHDEIDRDSEMCDWYRELIAFRKEGIAEGWLSPARMTSKYDRAHDAFSLQFSCDDGGTVAVHARLAAEKGRPIEPITLAVQGKVVLSSEPNADTGSGRILLQNNHAAISKSRC